MPKMTAQEKKWRAESDLHTLSEARKIMGDKDRLGAAKKMAEEQIKSLNKVRGTKNA